MKQSILDGVASIRNVTVQILFPFELIYIFLYALYIRIRYIHKLIVPDPPISLKGEIILITGGGDGIGRAICYEIAKIQRKLTIIIWDENERASLETVAELQALGVRNSFSFTVDVSDKEQVKAAAEKVRSEIGDVTILFNNASIRGNVKEGWLDDSAAIEKVFAVNVLAHCWTLKEFLPKMIENGKGHIMETCSLMGFMHAPLISSYVASKFALRGYIESIKEDIRYLPGQPKIHFSMLYPPVVATKMSAHLRRPAGRYTFLGQPCTPEFAASKIVHGVLHRKEHIYVLEFVRYMGLLLEILPPEATRKFYDFMGMESINLETPTPTIKKLA